MKSICSVLSSVLLPLGKSIRSYKQFPLPQVLFLVYIPPEIYGTSLNFNPDAMINKFDEV